MKIIDWNICCMKSPEPKVEFLQSVIGDNSFVAVLEEVTPSQYEVFKTKFANIRYSLDYRAPGRYDTGNRELGIAIICSDDIKIKSANVLTRCLLPDRTLIVDVEYKTSMLRIVGLHSITGCSHLNAKSMQFLSWAEVVDELHPDIVAFDANEPKKDHYLIDNMEFFPNCDKGHAARTFFEKLNEKNLHDAFIQNYDINDYREGEPLVVSHHIARGDQNKRYDFVFADSVIAISKCYYMYNESVKAGSDHALICCECNFKEDQE